MKKIICLILTIIMAISLSTAVSASGTNLLAAELYELTLTEGTDIDITSVVKSRNSADFTVTYSADKVTNDSNIAIVVYKPEEPGAVPTEDNIVYIDQFKHVDSSFSFPLRDSDTDGKYVILMGATGLNVAGRAEFNTFADVEPVISYGDVNVDSKVSTVDAVMTIQNVAGIRELTADQAIAADVDESGIIDMKDVLDIMLYSINQIDKLPTAKAVTASYDD